MTAIRPTNRVLPTKVTPPRYGKNLLFRQGLFRKLQQILQYSLTLIHAGPGYGKSLSVSATLAQLGLPAAWVSLEDGDSDPFLFCDCLITALETVLPNSFSSAREELNLVHTSKPWRIAVDTMIHDLCGADFDLQDLTLVIDDYHLVAGEKETDWITNYLLAHAPEWLHVVLISRQEITLSHICLLRARGELLEIGREELAMKKEEISELFSSVYGAKLSQQDVEFIWQRTEGWPIALQLLCNKLSKTAAGSLKETLPDDMEPLFQYLAQEVMARQPAKIRSAITQIAVLDEFSEEACNAVLGNVLPEGFFAQLKKKDLFLIGLGGGHFRFHHLFQEFLRKKLMAEEYLWWQLNRRAAEYHLQNDQAEKALNYFIRSNTWKNAVELLKELVPVMLENGRGGSLERILDKLPEKVIRENPFLLLAAGDAARQASNFERAKVKYNQALELAREMGKWRVESQANRGIALIYLDTVQPGPAEQYLRKSIKALNNSEVEERAHLVQLMAENKINQGNPRHAQRYQRLANEMLHMASRGDPDARLLLRTGRLEAAQKLLETKNSQEQKQQRPPRYHRETPLLLSLIYSFRGQADRALITAKEGITIGQYLESPFVVAVGQMRLGHAWLLQQPPQIDAAQEAYQKALEISDGVGVLRGRAEALMGLCLVYAYHGDLEKALQNGQEGIAVADQVHDLWFTTVLRLTLGIATAVCGKPVLAEEFLTSAKKGFRRCGDSHGLALCCWWQAYLAQRAQRREKFLAEARELLDLCQLYGYDFLLTGRTLLGARDARASLPLLTDARRQEIRRDYVEWVLSELGLEETETHPGYTLRIRTLGHFRVFRGDNEIKSRDWHRENAKQLFQLLLTKRKQLVHKEQLMEYLWPERLGKAADRDFKVALNALMKALEPTRPPRSSSAFITREGCSYGLNLASGYWLDVDEFESLVDRGFKALEKSEEQAFSLFKRALEMYKGDFLQEVLYDEWCAGERERLSVLYLKTAETMARLLAQRGDYSSTVEMCDRILAKDNCWEEAYRLKMLCYSRLGNRAMVVRVYGTCQDNLQHELGISPSAKTVELFQRLAGRKSEAN